MTPELVHAILWPTVVVVALILSRHRFTHFKLKVLGGEVEVSAKEAANMAQELLDEADRLIKSVTPKEQKLLAKVYSAPKMLTVEQLIPGFSRGSIEHEQLRKLRMIQLIRPASGKQWEAQEYVEIKPFGRILFRIRPKALLGEQA
ncbi:hypothetical protein VT84_33245 [Gemmata sp. SH-PL17]|uniref:hypothetical protein n=1 Tax=Gemmata sp. SH-PL17 TaxID=1630693 RepID=UPI00078EB816|nr:hypothetical protein [Gemmata sp. SH-PL17]AMV29309.1 hypothetical protein VT84_33245 [Gemmata sp. SH-PL17]